MAEPEPELTGRDLPGEAVSEPAGQLAPDAELVSESEIEAVSVGAVPESVTVSEEPLADEAAPAPSSEATTERGDTAQAIEQYTEALTAYQADGNIEDELAALEALAELNLEAENYEDVLAYVDRGMALAQESDNPLREGQLLVVLGDLQYIIGRLEGAETAYREAVTAFQPTASWDEIGLTLGKLGALYEEQGKLEDAITVWQQTVPIFERFNRDDELIDALNDLGDAHSRLMRWDDARAYYTQALEHIESLGDPEEIFDQVVLLATQLEASGNRHEATMYFQRALHLAFELGNQPRQGHVLLALARLMMDEGVLLNRVIQLLEAASERLPGNHAVQRLLRRAKTRQQRLTDAGITLILPEDSLEDYARAVVEWQSENIG
jgi:tetratricopeptide (TPR) repeat protein